MDTQVAQVLLLLVVAVLVGIGARRFDLPYTLALVVAGTGLGLLHLEPFEHLHLTPQLLLALFLPALLFEAAYHLDYSRFKANAQAILLLAVPGVVIAVAVTGFAGWGLFQLAGLPLSLGDAFLFASLIAATDPVSVLALFRSLGAPRRLYLIVEGESLLNDGIAVVAFVIVATILGIQTGHGALPELSGAGEIALYGTRTFLWMVGLGVGLGAALGALVSVLTRQVDDHLVETALTFVLAYGSFLVAEHLHASGVLACVSAGIVLGSFGSRFGMSASTRLAVIDFWEFMAFFSNSFVFLLVGLELDIPRLLSKTPAIAAASVAVLAGRAVAVYGLMPLTRWFRRLAPIPASWRHVLVWGGLRGSLSMVLVIGLPQDYVHRDTLLHLVFGVVSISLFLQGLTMGRLLSRLGLMTTAGQTPYRRERAQVLATGAALRELERMRTEEVIDSESADAVERVWRERRGAAEAAARRLSTETSEGQRMVQLAFRLMVAEEDALRHAASDGIVPGEVADELLLELELRRDRLSHLGPEEHLEVILAALARDLPGSR